MWVALLNRLFSDFARVGTVVSIVVLAASALSAQGLYSKPVKVLGDPNFVGTAANPLSFTSQGPNVVEGREMQSPSGIALDTSVSPPYLYVADTLNHRVLGYRYATQLQAGAFADLILGQPDRFTTLPGGSGGGPSTGLRLPTGLTVDQSGNLYVADTGNNRILRYPTPFAQPAGYQFPDIVIGQTGFTVTSANRGSVAGAATLALFNGSFSNRTGITIDGSGNLWVSDTNNNRVLRFPASVLKAQQFGPSADLAVGEQDLVTTTGTSNRISKVGLSGPTGLAFDAAGRLLVADQLARVLEFNPPFTLNQAASRIVGVDPTVGVQTPGKIVINTSQGIGIVPFGICVADTQDNRVVFFARVDQWPDESVQFSPSATQSLGQPDLTSILPNRGNGLASAISLSGPVDIATGGNELYVADQQNNRVVVYSLYAGGVTLSASRVIGQLDLTQNAPNLVEGKEFFTAASGGLGGSAILDYSATPPHLYVADTGNNRILGFSNFSSLQNGQRADIVIGQPDLLHAEINYPNGQANQPGQQGLNGPSSIAVDPAGNLWVADSLNSRVLRFPSPFASGKIAGETADLVIGQLDFSTQITDATASTMSIPAGIALSKDASVLAVADTLHQRVLIFKAPFSKGMVASIVLGQASFTTQVAAATPSGLSQPQAVAIDPNGYVITGDTGNRRLQVYPPVSTLTATGTAPSFAVTQGLSQPTYIGMGTDGQFWVADSASGANRVVHFTSVDKLPTANPPYSPDANVSVLSPQSAFTDQYGNLLVADGINRILYFAPQVDAQNAGNYLGTTVRGLAPGTFSTIYPTVKTNVIASGTRLSTALPWPTTSSDTQVVVGGIPAALQYVSPGQINFPMPMGLPTGGTVDLLVSRVSTGQIYGAVEIPMAQAAPALFVIGGLQSGPVAALNQDNSINTATNAAPRGTVVQLFGTGQGFITGAPPEGQAAGGPLPTPVLPKILLGPTGSAVALDPSSILYSGLAPTLVGVWQINVQIPADAPTGNVPISVLMNSIPSYNPAIPGQISTTIAIQ